MITAIIVIALALWAIVGFIFGFGLYESGAMPCENPVKRATVLFMVGPIWWVAGALVWVYKRFKRWVEKDPIQHSN